MQQRDEIDLKVLLAKVEREIKVQESLRIHEAHDALGLDVVDHI